MGDEVPPTMRRGLDGLDEALAEPSYLAAKQQRTTRPATIGLAVLVLVALGFIAWRWLEAQRRPARIEEGSRAVDTLVTE